MLYLQKERTYYKVAITDFQIGCQCLTKVHYRLLKADYQLLIKIVSI